MTRVKGSVGKPHESLCLQILSVDGKSIFWCSNTVCPSLLDAGDFIAVPV